MTRINRIKTKQARLTNKSYNKQSIREKCRMDVAMQKEIKGSYLKGTANVTYLVLLLAVLLTVGLFAYFINSNKTSESFLLEQAKTRQTLNTLLTADDTREFPWMRTLNPKAKRIEGQLVWNQEKQRGVVELKNLPDTTANEQYYVWAYDNTRADNDKSVSLAAFSKDESMDDDLLVELKPQNKVVAPYKFIVTLEDKSGKNSPQNLLRAQP